MSKSDKQKLARLILIEACADYGCLPRIVEGPQPRTFKDKKFSCDRYIVCFDELPGEFCLQFVPPQFRRDLMPELEDACTWLRDEKKYGYLAAACGKVYPIPDNYGDHSCLRDQMRRGTRPTSIRFRHNKNSYLGEKWLLQVPLPDSSKALPCCTVSIVQQTAASLL